MSPLNLKSGRCENAAFVRCLLEILRVEGVKTKLWCDASFKFVKLKMWKRSFRAMPPSNLKSWRCENKAFVRCLLQVLTRWCNARSQDTLRNTIQARAIAILLQFRAIDKHNPMEWLHIAPANRNFTIVSGDRHARAYGTVARSTGKLQFYYSFGRSTRRILRMGCRRTTRIAILPQFPAIDAHDPTWRLPQNNRNRNFTIVSGDRRARFYGRVAADKQESQFYYSFGWWTRTILFKGCTFASICRTLPCSFAMYTM